MFYAPSKEKIESVGARYAAPRTEDLLKEPNKKPIDRKKMVRTAD